MKMPYNIKQECIWIVRGYENRVRNYQEMRSEILCESSAQSGFGGGLPSNPVEGKTIRLSELEELPEVQKMRAVEQALRMIGADIQSKELQQKLRESIYINCLSGRKNSFEHLGIDGISRRDFYRRKDNFLRCIAIKLGYIS